MDDACCCRVAQAVVRWAFGAGGCVRGTIADAVASPDVVKHARRGQAGSARGAGQPRNLKQSVNLRSACPWSFAPVLLSVRSTTLSALTRTAAPAGACAPDKWKGRPSVNQSAVQRSVLNSMGSALDMSSGSEFGPRYTQLSEFGARLWICHEAQSSADHMQTESADLTKAEMKAVRAGQMMLKMALVRSALPHSVLISTC